MDELPSLGLNLDEASWCEGCQRRQQVIDEHEKEKALNYKTLKQKIVSTDLLIKKFRSKCEEYDQQSKMLEDVTRKLERAKRDTETLDNQLKNALQQIEPLKLENNSSKTAMMKKDSEIDILHNRIIAADKMREQFEAFGQDTDKLKAKAEKLEKEKKTFDKKIESAETSKSKMEKELLSCKDTIKTLKQEKKTLEKKLDKAHQIQEKHFERLQENNLLTKYDKRIRNSLVKQQQCSDDGDDDFMPVDEIPFNPNIKVKAHKSFQVIDLDSMVTMSPLNFPMSPLPPTPQPIEKDDSDIDTLSEILESELTQFDSSHLSSSSESEEVSDCRTTVCDPQCEHDNNNSEVSVETVNENNNATISLKPGVSIKKVVVPNEGSKTVADNLLHNTPIQTAVIDETKEDGGEQRDSSTSTNTSIVPVELDVHVPLRSLEQPNTKAISTVQDTMNSDKLSNKLVDNLPNSPNTVVMENKEVSQDKPLSDQTVIINGEQLKHEVEKSSGCQFGSTLKERIIHISSFAPLGIPYVETESKTTQNDHVMEDQTSSNPAQISDTVVTDNSDIQLDVILVQNKTETDTATVQEDGMVETVEKDEEVNGDILDMKRYEADKKSSSADLVTEILNVDDTVDETLDSFIDDKALIEFVPKKFKSFDPLNEVIVIDDEDTPIKIEPVLKLETKSERSSLDHSIGPDCDLHMVEMEKRTLETSETRTCTTDKESSGKHSEISDENSDVDNDKLDKVMDTTLLNSPLKNESNEHSADSNTIDVMKIPRQNYSSPTIRSGVEANCDNNTVLKNVSDKIFITKPDAHNYSQCAPKKIDASAMEDQSHVNKLCPKTKSLSDKSGLFSPIKMELPECVSVLSFGNDLDPEDKKCSDLATSIANTMGSAKTEPSVAQNSDLDKNNVPKKKYFNDKNPSLFSPIKMEALETLSDLGCGSEMESNNSTRQPNLNFDSNVNIELNSANEMDKNHSLTRCQHTIVPNSEITLEAKDSFSSSNYEMKVENVVAVTLKFDTDSVTEVKLDETVIEKVVTDLKTMTSASIDVSDISHIVTDDNVHKHLSESSLNSDQKSESELELISAECLKRQKRKAKKRKRKEEKRLHQSENVRVPTFSEPLYDSSSSFKPIIISQKSTGFNVSNSLDESQPSCSKNTNSSLDILDIIFNSSDFLTKLSSDSKMFNDASASKSPFHLIDYFKPISPLPPSPEPLLFLEEESCLTTFDSIKVDHPEPKKLKLQSYSATITSQVKNESDQSLSNYPVTAGEKTSLQNIQKQDFKTQKRQMKRKSIAEDIILPAEHINEDASDQLLGKKARISRLPTTNGTSAIRKTQLIPVVVPSTVPASKLTTSKTLEPECSKSGENQTVLRRSRRTKNTEIKMEVSDDKDISNIEEKSDETKKDIVPNVLTSEANLPISNAGSTKLKVELQTPSVNKFIPNSDQMEKDLDSVMKRGAEELNSFLDKYFQDHQLPQWFQLVQIIIKTLKQTKTNLHPEISKNSKNPAIQPVLFESETNLLVLLQNIFSKYIMCSDTIILNMLLNSVICENGTGQSKAAMCRIFTGLCRLKGDLEQARVLAYEVIFHLCVSNHTDGSTLVLAITGVWPLIFDAKFPVNNVMPSVMEHVVMNMSAEHRYSQTKNFNSLSELCQWGLVLPADNAKIVCENIIKYLKIVTGSDPDNKNTEFKGNVFEGVAALKLLFKMEDFNFFYIHFVNRFLSSASQKWSGKAEKGDLTPQYLESMLRVVCEIDLMEKRPEISRINSMSKNYLMPVLNKQSAFKIVSYTAAEAMMKLSPFSPQCICSFLQFWYRKNKDEIPEDIKTKLRQTRKYLLDNFTNFNCAEFV